MKTAIFLLSFCFLAFSTVFGAISPDAAKWMEDYLNKAAANGYSGSALVAHQKKILLSKGFGMADREKNVPFVAETVFDIGSITKQFTAAGILKLEMQGKLSVQDPITKYFEKVPEDKKQIKLHHLLTHTAGLEGGLGPDEEFIAREEYVTKALNSKLSNPIGEYSYSNVGFSLLAAILEKVSGQEYEKYIRENLFSPAEMKETGYVLPAWDNARLAIGYSGGRRWGTTYDKSQYDKGVTWHLKGNGGIHSTVGDMYRWYVALQGDKILSAEAKRKYFHPHVKEDPEGSSHYAYGWTVAENQRKEKVIAHNGGNGYFMATMAMIPSSDTVIVVSTNHNPKNTDAIATRLDRILFENLTPLTDSFIKKYSGEYTLPKGSKVKISFNENDEAVALMNQKESFELLSGSEEDKPQEAAKFDARTTSVLRAFSSRDFKTAASLINPEEKSETFVQEIRGMYENLVQDHGAITDIDVIGSVSRRQGQLYLTVAKLKCDKGEVYQMYIWEGDRLFDFRNLHEGNTKPFAYHSKSEFFAESNNKRIVFETRAGKHVLIVRTKTGDIIATKVK